MVIESFDPKRRISEWPWELTRNPATHTPDDKDYFDKYVFKQPKFSSICYENKHLDRSTRRAAIEASESVVSLVSYSDDEEIFQGSGTITKNDGTILTSAKFITCPTRKNEVAKNIKVTVYLWDAKSYEAKVLAYDLYFGIAVVKIQLDFPLLKAACLRSVDDCVSLDLSELPIREEKGFQLRPHSSAYNLVPGDKLIALGRYSMKPYDLMAAPGEFSINLMDDRFKCNELFRSTCLIGQPGIGGPIINQYGEVIGMASCDDDAFTPFVPINIVFKWCEHYETIRKLSPRPLLGMRMANLYSSDLQVLEKLIQKFPTNFIGVTVEEVEQSSSADVAGICPNDIIIKCCGKTVRGFLELFDMMWDNIGDSVDLVVIRASDDYASLHLKMKVVEA